MNLSEYPVAFLVDLESIGFALSARKEVVLIDYRLCFVRCEELIKVRSQCGKRGSAYIVTDFSVTKIDDLHHQLNV